MMPRNATASAAAADLMRVMSIATLRGLRYGRAMRRPTLSLLVTVIAPASALPLAGGAPAHDVTLVTCDGPFHFRNSHDKTIEVKYIDLVNPSLHCDDAKRVLRNFIDSETTHPWTCHARFIQNTWGFGRGYCTH